MRIRSIIAAVLAFSAHLLFSTEAEAQVSIPRIGLMSSPKAFGITVQSVDSHKDVFDTFSLMADMDGVFNGEAKDPGAKMSWIHGEPVFKGDEDGFKYTFYAGAGASFAFVRDFGNALHRNHGFMLAMSAASGFLLEFPGHIDLSVDLTADLGLHLRKDEVYPDRFDLSWYANGILNVWMPQITLYYRF